MNVGKRSLMFGAHQFLLHPVMLGVAWHRLYGWPRKEELLPLITAFVIHDWGYWFADDMDGVSGERHPEYGAGLMCQVYGKEWGEFCLLHSRFYARQLGREPSALCAADKLATALEPWWLYLPRVVASGEVWEYIAEARSGKYQAEVVIPSAGGSFWEQYRLLRAWHREMQRSTRQWVKNFTHWTD